ncbi:MAG: hypothetical protein HONBIEJF_00097 [Fimbriimonadaceae bacterium]|nr:hypothetical protein [Fimbriimonadaceae bacterium]
MSFTLCWSIEMKRIGWLLVVLLPLFSMAADVVKVEALLKSPDKFHEKVVTAKGKVTKFEAKVSKKGNPYNLFQLADGKGTVNIYVRGKLAKPLKDGQTVEVTGTFRKEKKLRDFTVKNEIDASPGSDKQIGVKVLK